MLEGRGGRPTPCLVSLLHSRPCICLLCIYVSLELEFHYMLRK